MILVPCACCCGRCCVLLVCFQTIGSSRAKPLRYDHRVLEDIFRSWATQPGLDLNLLNNVRRTMSKCGSPILEGISWCIIWTSSKERCLSRPRACSDLGDNGSVGYASNGDEFELDEVVNHHGEHDPGALDRYRRAVERARTNFHRIIMSDAALAMYKLPRLVSCKSAGTTQRRGFGGMPSSVAEMVRG